MSAEILVFVSFLFSAHADYRPKPPAEKERTNPDVKALESIASLSIIGQTETQSGAPAS